MHLSTAQLALLVPPPCKGLERVSWLVILLAHPPLNNPIPSNLKSEAKKAAKILREFTEISNRIGPDKLIPAHIIAKAQGLAVITVIKAGFMITARGGSGIVIARLADGSWSAPSAIGIAGLGGGFEIGVEVSDLVIILMQRRAVDAFTKGGNLTLGGNCTVAVGPLGRNVAADVALRSTAAVFTYCKSRGLFAGVSLEGSYLIERKETNRKFYSQDIRASAILNGDVEPPPAAHDLYDVLEAYTEAYTTDWTNKNLRPKVTHTLTQRDHTNKWIASGAGPSSSAPLVVTALHPFTGQQPGDLSFNVGDQIMVLTQTDSQNDWWEGQLGRNVGIFPANFVSSD
ncbi:SH3 domain-containing YSC84-like protein 1 [Aplochiton taeniatus]